MKFSYYVGYLITVLYTSAKNDPKNYLRMIDLITIIIDIRSTTEKFFSQKILAKLKGLPMEQDPRKILRKEESPTAKIPFEDYYQSPAQDLAHIRLTKNRGLDPKRQIQLANKKWRLVYGMRYDKGK